MNGTNHKHTVLVGAFVFFGLAILVAGVLVLANQRNTFNKAFIVRAVFDDLKGLLKGNDVWYAGIKIGTVKRINIAGNGLAEVDMKIDETARSVIYKDSRAKLGADGLIGNRIIIVYGGTPGNAVADGDVLKTDTMLKTGEMLTALQANNKNLVDITGDVKIVTRRLANGEGTVGHLLTNDSLARILQATAMTLQSASRNMKSFTSDIVAYTSKLQTRGSLTNNLVTDTMIFSRLRSASAQIDQTSANAKKASDNLVVVSNSLKDSSGTIGVLLHDQQTAEALKASMGNIQNGTKKFDENMEAMQHNFLLRRFFKKRAKQQRQDSATKQNIARNSQ